jgi:hypothetical protein
MSSRRVACELILAMRHRLIGPHRHLFECRDRERPIPGIAGVFLDSCQVETRQFAELFKRLKLRGRGLLVLERVRQRMPPCGSRDSLPLRLGFLPAVWAGMLLGAGSLVARPMRGNIRVQRHEHHPRHRVGKRHRHHRTDG